MSMPDGSVAVAMAETESPVPICSRLPPVTDLKADVSSFLLEESHAVAKRSLGMSPLTAHYTVVTHLWPALSGSQV